jgi:hypothetical protein
MGTDIHLYVETRKDGVWYLPTEPNPWHEKYPEDKDERPTRPVDGGYDSRNYSLFAILADVRNGRWGEAPTRPISEPRGVPDDASEAYRAESGDDWGHSYSWFTLTELLAHDWDGEHADNTALVHPGGMFRQEKLPADFDLDAFAQEVQAVLGSGGHEAMWERWPSIGMCAAIHGPNAHEWRRVNWVATHRQQAGRQWFEFLDGLQKHAKSEGLTPDDIRIVFFFDS